LQKVKPITQTPRRPPTHYEEYTFEEPKSEKKKRAVEATEKLLQRVTPVTQTPRKPPTVKTMERGEIVKKIMKQYNMTLPQASKFVKENNLYQHVPKTKGTWL
jgi:hypothetical protein